MISIDRTRNNIAMAQDQLKHHKPLSPSLVFEMKKADKEYKAETNKLYSERTVIKKIGYFFGIGKSEEEKAQLFCIKKIAAIRGEAKYGGTSWLGRALGGFIQSIYRGIISSRAEQEAGEEKFIRLLEFSLKDNVTDAERAEIAKFHGSSFYAPDVHFERMLDNFAAQENLRPDEAEKAKEVLKSFQFNKKVKWKATKHHGLLAIGHQHPWYPANAASALHKAIHKMEPGQEVVFSGHARTSEDSAHAVLFSCMKLDDDHVCVRLYNTGFAAQTGITWGGVFQTGYDVIWKGQGLETSLLNNMHVTVEQTVFDTSTVLSDDFAKIFTDEILYFNRGEANKDIFPKYKAFAAENGRTVDNAPPVPIIKTQKTGNCSIASKLAYIESKLGEDLNNKFKNYIQAYLAEQRALS